MEDVNIIWSEMVKPCDPTPSHLKTRKLSRLDQMFPLLHNRILLFYSSSSSSSSSSDHDELMLTMKASLSKALSQFYPLAGRLIDDSTLLCNDQGVPLVYSKVTCSLKSYLSPIGTTVLNSDNTKLPLNKLVPSQDLLHGYHQQELVPISAWVQLAIQVNVFECGGIAIGCYKNHKLLDVISLITFLKHWAGLCQGQGPEHLIQPDFDAAPVAFPPYAPERILASPMKSLDAAKRGLLKLHETSTTCKVFVFKSNAISCLREMLAGDLIPHPSRVESVLGFLWKHCLEAERGQVGPTTLTLTISMRTRADPPFSKGSIGNIGSNVVARVEEHANELSLVDLVAEIRAAINGFNYDQKVREILVDKGGEVQRENNETIAKERLKPNIYRVSCQCRLGFTDVDFGFGKPSRICPVTESFLWQRKFIFLMDHIDPNNTAGQDQVNGIEAWLVMDKSQMQILEKNPNFLAFASPLDLSSTN